MNIVAFSVPVDREGMVVSDAIKLAPRARAAVVTLGIRVRCASILPRRRRCWTGLGEIAHGSLRTIMMVSTAMSAGLCLR